jgi:hypothetical protein
MVPMMMTAQTMTGPLGEATYSEATPKPDGLVPRRGRAAFTYTPDWIPRRIPKGPGAPYGVMQGHAQRRERGYFVRMNVICVVVGHKYLNAAEKSADAAPSVVRLAWSQICCRRQDA